MVWLKKNIIFTAIMVVLAGILAFEIFLVLGERDKARQAENSLNQKMEEFQRLVNQPVLPHTRNIDLTAEEIERQRAELEVYVDSMRGREELLAAFDDYPRSGRDAVFDIQFFAEEYRQRAAAATGMEEEDLEGEYFGFGAYATTGPSQDQLASVYKQRLVVAYILDRLFVAEPETLLSVRRPGEGRGQEDAAPARPGGRTQAQAGGAGFRLPPQLSAAIPDIAEASPYEVAFVGYASTLRTFLNELASFDMPLIVRSVQVTPASDAATGRGQPAAPTGRRERRAPIEEDVRPVEEEDEETTRRDENILLVEGSPSRFTVALEFIDVVPLNSR